MTTPSFNSKALLISLHEFAKKTNTPLSFVDYILKKHQTDFKNEFIGSAPSLFLVQNENKTQEIYLHASQIRNFIKRNFLLLQLLGLKKEVAQALLDQPDSFSFTPSLYKEKISTENIKKITKESRQKN